MPPRAGPCPNCPPQDPSSAFLCSSPVPIGGLLVSAATYAVGRAQDPETPRFSFPVIAPIGILLPAALAFSVVSLGLSLFGSSLDGVVAVPITAFVTRLGRCGTRRRCRHGSDRGWSLPPLPVGDPNEATPSTSEAFWSDFGRAIGIPAVAIAIGALLAIGLAQVLLSADSTVVTVTVFSVVGAIILGGTTLLALRPWEKK